MKWRLLLGLLGLVASPLWGQEDLFTTAQDLVVPAASPSPDPEGPQPLRLSGSTVAKAGYYYGWRSSDGAGTQGEGLELTQSLTLDAKPLRSLAAHATFQAVYPSAGASLDLTEVWVDATLFDRVLVRSGKGRTLWTPARLFTAADLASETQDGLSVRVSVPYLGGEVTALVTAPVGSGFDYSANGDLQGRAFDRSVQALRWGAQGSGWEGHLAIRHRNEDPITKSGYTDAVAGARVTLWGVDLFDDVLVRAPQGREPGFGTVAGGFTERALGAGRERIQVYGEFEALPPVPSGPEKRQSALVLRFVGLGPWKGEVGARWTRSWTDGASEVLVGGGLEVEEGLKLDLGLPLTSGSGLDDTGFLPPSAGLKAAIGARVTVTATY